MESTHWSLVLRAGRAAEPEGRAALATLCERYWLPVYAFVRRRVPRVHDAQDLTQAFFVRLLDKNLVGLATPEQGRFRGFLLTSVRNFLLNEWERGAAEKRGGGRLPLSLDLDSGESRLRIDPVDERTPERVFDAEWALVVLETVMNRLKQEFETARQGGNFELMRTTLTGDRERLPYREIGDELGLSEEAARQAAARFRKRYRELLREEVAQTVDRVEDVDDEIRNLFAALG